jgi:DnaJ-class molecular chaperone
MHGWGLASYSAVEMGPRVMTCPECFGRGVVRYYPYDLTTYIMIACWRCNGTGRDTAIRVRIWVDGKEVD